MQQETMASGRGRWYAAVSRLKALGWPIAVTIASLALGNGLVSRVAEGWRKTQDVWRREGELERCQAERRRLAERVRRLQTDEGQRLEAHRYERVEPKERAIVVQPVLPPESGSEDATLSERAESWRAQAAAALWEQWRIFVRWAFNVRLEGSPAASDGGARTLKGT